MLFHWKLAICFQAQNLLPIELFFISYAVKVDAMYVRYFLRLLKGFDLK